MSVDKQNTCEWEEEKQIDETAWKMSCCEELWSFTCGGVKENRMKYCPYCGKLIRIKHRRPNET